ncbi:hypothetical protein ACYOEI_29920, partial [Singulisphaera rosea]
MGTSKMHRAPEEVLEFLRGPFHANTTLASIPRLQPQGWLGIPGMPPGGRPGKPPWGRPGKPPG